MSGWRLRDLSGALRRSVPVLIGVAAGGMLLGALLLWSGAVSVAASSGHWPMMNWLLHTAARRSVATHSAGIDVPDLSHPRLLQVGARQYRAQCETCHGAPGATPSLLMQHMTPPAPLLVDFVEEWKPRELFWIIKHGIKYSAMPAWVTQDRDDDIWPVVAFIQQLPGMDEARYLSLAVAAEPATSMLAKSLSTCASCHGEAGEGAAGMPRLAGQSAEYLKASLDAYAEGQRASGLMQPIAAGLTEDTRQALARQYAAAAPATGDLPSVSKGQQLVSEGDAAKGIPPCMACHGGGSELRNPRYPLLAGQPRDYLAQQLRLFRSGQRGGSSYAPLMQTIAARMSDAQIEQAADFYGVRARE